MQFRTFARMITIALALGLLPSVAFAQAEGVATAISKATTGIFNHIQTNRSFPDVTQEEQPRVPRRTFLDVSPSFECTYCGDVFLTGDSTIQGSLSESVKAKKPYSFGYVTAFGAKHNAGGTDGALVSFGAEGEEDVNRFPNETLLEGDTLIVLPQNNPILPPGASPFQASFKVTKKGFFVQGLAGGKIVNIVTQQTYETGDTILFQQQITKGVFRTPLVYLSFDFPVQAPQWKITKAGHRCTIIGTVYNLHLFVPRGPILR